MDLPQKLVTHSFTLIHFTTFYFVWLHVVRKLVGGVFISNTHFFIIIIIIFIYIFIRFFTFLKYYYTFLCVLHLIISTIVKRWFAHLGDSVPSVCRGGSWMHSLFCCLLCDLVGHSKWLLSWWGRNVELLMCWIVSQLTFLHCFLFCH